MKKVKPALLALIVWFIIHEIAIIIDGVTTQPTKSEYAVIFGNTVNADGTLSDRLKARVDKGLELYNKSIAEKIFVSGGLGKEGIYEAQAMASYLIQKGVPESDVVIDDNGYTSWLTASNFKEILPDSKSVIVVTQYHHISRSKLAFRKVGIENVSGASPDYFELRDMYSLVREFFGYYKYLLLY